jgi:nucleoside-diphosphate-sugar epimerase
VRVGITGGTGFVGRHLARALSAAGHEVVLVARGVDRRDPSTAGLPGVRLARADVGSGEGLAEAFAGCEAVAHCAGINKESGTQTYLRVHVAGTRHVVEACRKAGVRRLLILSFLRARPGCGSAYHESKWAAEEIVRSSGLDYLVVKAGVMYGRGDHMLDHLGHALSRLRLFATVGLRGKNARPAAIEDVVRLLAAFLIDGRLRRRTVAVFGPEEIPLGEAVRRVARVLGRRVAIVPMPVAFHYLLAFCLERLMPIPLVSIAQVRILSEGIVEPLPACDLPPQDLRPSHAFTDDQIRRGLPADLPVPSRRAA